MKKSWDLIPMILEGRKRVESRWYMARYTPWDKVRKGDTVYFKDSGGPVTVKARIIKVDQYEVRDDHHALKILQSYYNDLGHDKKPQELSDYIRGKRYAIFVFFDSVEEIESFEIDKTGFGISSAWMVIEDVEKVKAL